MAEPTERDRELADQALSGLLSQGTLHLNVLFALAQAREEGRRVGLQDAKAACREVVAGEDAKAMGFKSWSAELCINAIEAMEAQDG